MTFSRTALLVVGAAMLAGAGYGYWTYRSAPLQTANVAQTVDASRAQLLAGTWTSADDAAYTVSFTDGAIAERYEGADTATGSYRFASSPAGYVSADMAYEEAPDGYLLEDIDGEKYAYRVLALTEDRLELSYLERGNTLSFRR